MRKFQITGQVGEGGVWGERKGREQVEEGKKGGGEGEGEGRDGARKRNRLAGPIASVAYRVLLLRHTDALR